MLQKHVAKETFVIDVIDVGDFGDADDGWCWTEVLCGMLKALQNSIKSSSSA